MKVLEAILGFILENPEWGWLLVIAGGIQQLFSPWETKVKSLVARVETRLERLEQMQKVQMTVIRAVVRTNDEVDTEKVDRYLVENGVHPETFIRGKGESPEQPESHDGNRSFPDIKDEDGTS